MTFIATYNLEDSQPYPTLKEAFKYIYDRIVDATPRNLVTIQLLESAVWVKSNDDILPMMFYDLRDIAVNEGWIKEGKWVG